MLQVLSQMQQLSIYLLIERILGSQLEQSPEGSRHKAIFLLASQYVHQV